MSTKKNPVAWIALLLVSSSGAAFAADTPSGLREQIAKTEQEFIALYNKLNTDRQYDMICKTERATGANPATRVCQPRYLQAAQQANASERVQAAAHAGPGGEVSNPGAAPSFAQDDGFRKNVLELMQKSPRLQALGEKRDALQARLDELTKK